MVARSLPALLVLLLAPSTARAVDVEVAPLFSPGGVSYDGWSPFLVTVCGEAALTADLEVAVSPGWSNDRAHQVSSLRIPPNGCSRTISYVMAQGQGVRATVRDASGQRIATSRWRWQGATASHTLAILDQDAIAWGAHEEVAFLHVGPVLPDRAIGWAPADAVLMSADRFERMQASEREAILVWVDVGGRLVVVGPGASSDEVRGLGRIVKIGEAELRPEEPGSPASEARWGGEKLGEVLREMRRSARRPLWKMAGPDSFLYGQGREAIDYNARTKPPIGIVAALLLAYILLIGPVQFRWLARRGRALVALGTLPILAAVFFAALVGLGHGLKGSRSRYDALTLIEAGSGGDWAVSRRYAGLFSTRSGRVDVHAAPGALVHRFADPGPRWKADHSVIRGASMTLDTIPVGLWETLFVREDTLVPLGSGVDVESVPGGVVVGNETRWPLGEAVLAMGSTRIPIGTIAPGERRFFSWSEARRTRLPRGFWLLPPVEIGGLPVLLARIEPGVLPAFPGFARGRELTLLRVVGR